MKSNHVLELRVGVDVGCHNHNVAIGLSTGEILEEFSIKIIRGIIRNSGDSI